MIGHRRPPIAFRRLQRRRQGNRFFVGNIPAIVPGNITESQNLEKIGLPPADPAKKKWAMLIANRAAVHRNLPERRVVPTALERVTVT